MASVNLGKVVGDSAYEVWLDEGHTGTVQDFLDSLNGPQGNPGKDGKDGYSPIAEVTETNNIITISITDKNGTTTASIDLNNYATKQYVDNLIGNINSILSTLATPTNNGGEE